MTSIAIIGSGLSGLVLAGELRNIANIKVFEKSRGIGGRMATRYQDAFSGSSEQPPHHGTLSILIRGSALP